MNFQYGTELANYQDSIFKQIENNIEISTTVLKQLTTNKWISIATAFAPSNLTVRQYCLIDFICHHYFNINKILFNLTKLVYSSKKLQYLLWIEGYSYWLYTKPFLKMYLEKIKLPDDIHHKLSSFIFYIDLGFSISAYRKNGEIYPAPFGDLRNVKLENQKDLTKNCITIGPIKKYGSLYYIRKQPLGFNLHSNSSDYVVNTQKDKLYIVDSNEEKEYKFYEGYKKKYPTILSELNDMITFGRIFSIWSLILKSKNVFK